MNYLYAVDNGKIGIDMLPELYEPLKEFVESLDLDTWGGGADNWISELEYRRRDGFIPHSHNHGGFDVYNVLESHYDSEHDDDGTLIMHGFRIMYEGDSTICIYYCQWDEEDIWGIHKAPITAEATIEFSTPEDMIAQLRQFTDKYTK